MKNLTQKLHVTAKTFLAFSLLASGVGVYGDDTEVFYSVNVSKPNLLFVLDNSGSMNDPLSGTSQSKLSILQQAVQQVLLDAPDNVNVGLMRFGPGMNGSEWNTSNEGNRTHGVSGVAFPLADINSKARDIIPTTADVYGLGVYPSEDEQIRSYASRVVNNWTASGGTPLVDALYEAALYYRGEEMRYGYDSPSGSSGVGAHPSTYLGSNITNDVTRSTRDYTQAPQYISPVNSSCQANYIVLMSDGQPTYYYNGRANTQGAAWSQSRGPFAEIMQGNSGYSNLALNLSSGCADTPSTFASGKCGPELTQYIATHDNIPSPSASFPEGKYGDQFIETFTIGFGTGAGTNTEAYLKSLATYDDEDSSTSDDGYFLAQSPAQLATAFKNILSAVAQPKGTLASPGYSVNVKNGLEHEKDIYIPVFDRKNTSRWSGNLKKFKIVDVDGRRLIQGKNNLNATNELGAFTSSALDYWSDSPNSEPDGTAVEAGGLANKLTDPAARKIYSNLTGDTNVALSVGTDNKLDMSVNSNISNADLGLASSSSLAYRTQIVNFMRGWDQGLYNPSSSSPGTPRLHMGDMLHSEPLVITYEKGSSTGSGKQQYIFAGTNEGYLHAFDTETGEEKFAFIPAELLKTISEPQFLNTGNQDDHKYGVDGSLTYWFKGGDDGSVTTGDQIIVYFGLRRGGSSYYALDVTDIDNPILLWKRSYAPGTVGNKSMGQSWSVPYLDKVGVNGSTCIDGSLNCQEAVIVSGGYDEDEDRDNTRTFCANEHATCTIPTGESATVWYGANDTWVSRENVTNSISCSNSVFGDPLVGTFKSCEIEVDDGSYDSTSVVTADVGNDIQIYNADNGDLIWSMPDSMRSQITSSIPGGVRVLDTNYNGLIDRMYFADTGGNVWRLDLSESLGSSTDTSVLTKLASLGGSGANSRKFYNEPDAAKMILNGKPVFAISIGSGFRAHPLDETITDNFFVLIDDRPYDAYTDEDPKTTSAITVSDLATLNVSLTGSTAVNSIKDANSKGWVVNFADAGEKVLGGALTVDGGVVFTTLVPEPITNSNLIDQCAAPATQSRLYAIDLLTGGAILDLNDDGVVTPDDIGETQGTEILNKVQIVYNPPVVTDEIGDNGEPTGEKECTHPVDIRAGKKLSQSSGYDACRLESVYWSDPQAE